MSPVDTATTAWVRRFHPTTEATTRLVCFAHAGGSASFFHPISARFSPDADVVALQYPGRQDRYRERCLDDVGEIAEHVAAELSTLHPLPTVFFGHSMGAVVGFETARVLERLGSPAAPCALLVSGRRAPSIRRGDYVHHYDDTALIREMVLLGGTDMATLDEEFLKLAIPAVRADYKAVETYRAAEGETVGCAVHALVGGQDPRTTVDEATEWRRHTTAEFSVEVYPGGHFFLVDQVGAVGDDIERWLTRARGDDKVLVALEGGPDDLVSPISTPSEVIDECRIKIPHRNGYEHFEASSDDPEEQCPVPFRWTMRTEMAE